MNILSATFECSAPDLNSCPDESLPEFAFIGRSNVGKSSLLNLLAGKEALARVSPTPGFTKLINFFNVDKTWRLVDLPGYGFAQVARAHSARFNKAVSNYLRDRKNLTCVFALFDSGLTPQMIDLEFVEWLARHSVPFVMVFTKTDKVTQGEVQANITAFTDRIAPWFETLPPVYTCSSKNKQGRAELLGIIGECLATIRAKAELEPVEPAPLAESKAASSNAISKAKRKRSDPSCPW